MPSKNSITICGAGIAGVATAYYLLKKNKNIEVILVDKNQPLSFTTSKSGENFRDYWPQKQMRNFVSDSILLMQELKEMYGEDVFEMKYTGYNFISHDVDNPIFKFDSQEDLTRYIEEITAIDEIQNEHSYLEKGIRKIVKIKNAGKIDVYALGSLLLQEARKMGLKLVEGEIIRIDKKDTNYQIV